MSTEITLTHKGREATLHLSLPFFNRLLEYVQAPGDAGEYQQMTVTVFFVTVLKMYDRVRLFLVG